MSNPISAIASVAGSLIGGSASKSAASAQAGASDRANDMQYRMFQEQAEMQKPWREAGENALGFLREGLQPDGRFMQEFGMDQFKADPGYGFRLSEGLKALDRQAAARGGLISGAALKGAARYGQDMVSNEYTNAFNRFRLERGDQFNRLAGVAGVGQSAVNQLGQQSAQLGQSMGNNMIGAGNARASGYMGQANAIAGGLGQAANMYQQNQMIGRMFPSVGGGGGGGGPNIYNEGGYGDFSGGGYL
jgi:hypothetical protein